MCLDITKCFPAATLFHSQKTATHGERTPAGHTEGMRAILIGTNKELKMPGNPRDTIVSAERRFPVRIRIVFRPAGSANATPK